MFDTSGSMGNKLDEIATGGGRSSSRPPIPRTSSFSFNSTIVRSSSSPSPLRLEEIQNRLTFTQSKGKTALLDAVYLALDNMRESQESAQGPADHLRRRATTAADTPKAKSRTWCAKRTSKSMRSVFSSRCPRAGARPRNFPVPSLLNEMAEQTGGRHFPVENVNELPDVAAKIGIELRNQYVLGYSPNQAAARWKISQGAGEAGATARTASASGVLENGLLCSDRIVADFGFPRCWSWAALCSGLSKRRHRSPRTAGQEQTGTVFRTDTRLVVLHATVVDKNGHLVTNLAKEAFQVFENDVQQQVKVFKREDVPVSHGPGRRQQRQYARQALPAWNQPLSPW